MNVTSDNGVLSTASTEKSLILIIDDIVENIQLLDDFLGDDYAVQYALSGADGLALARRSQPDLIILDVMMPVMDGYQACALLKNDPITQDIPVIFVTSRNDPASESQALAVGGVDFIHKPVNRDVLRARLRLHLNLKIREREIGRIHDLNLEEKQKQLVFALRAADAGMWTWNPATHQSEWTESIWNLLGLVPGCCEPSFDAWASSVHPDDLAWVVLQTERALHNRTGLCLEWRVLNSPPDRPRWLLSRGQPVFDDKGQLEVYRGIVFDISERKRIEAALAESRTHQKELSRRLMDIQEEEWRRLARELHDEIGQVLTAVNISLKSAQLVTEPDRLQNSLRHCADLVGRAIKQVRGRSLDLRPSMLDDLGLIPAIEHHIERQIELGVCAIELQAEPLPNRPPARIEIACYRIMQEAVTNALRHARASHIGIELSNDGERLWLKIKDNGRGFDVDEARMQARSGGSFGLMGMQERAVLNGGEIEIVADIHAGCEIRAWLPLGTMPLS